MQTAVFLLICGTVLSVLWLTRGRSVVFPHGDHAHDGYGCPACGHTPDEAGLRPRTERPRGASCWAQVDASGWGDPCGCADVYHGS